MPFRFKVDEIISVGERCSLDRDASRKLIRVLRHDLGDCVEILSRDGRVYSAEIVGIEEGGRRVIAKIVEEVHSGVRLDLPRFVVIQALPKLSKMDFIVQKLTECGADEILPILGQRSFGHGIQERGLWLQKRARYEKIIAEAVAQSGRTTCPVLEDLIPMEDLEKRLSAESGDGVRLVFDENADPREAHLGNVIRRRQRDVRDGSVRRIYLAVGPEGGFSDQENALFRRLGFCPVSLGDLVLRVETAGMIALAVTRYEILRDATLAEKG